MMDILSYTKKYKDIVSFIEFISNDGNKFTQGDIIASGINNESCLAIIPTGSGKSLCYQIPAIFDYDKDSSLTLVISPLKSLMKDQIDNFNQLFAQHKAGALSSFLSYNERLKLIEEIKNGEIALLYIAPESLRFPIIQEVLKNRKIARIVIDEVHCLSTWGHEFRSDYRNLASYIQNNFAGIPIFGFSATASKEVVQDIENYFYTSLGVKFEKYIAPAWRDNLNYKVFKVKNDDEKYEVLLKHLKKQLIIYVPGSRAKCDELVEKLSRDSAYKIAAFHSKSKNKDFVQKRFIADQIDIIVATNAFGMGVDKSNIASVIHYTPSDTIEDYLQETGRAARDKRMVGECIALYNEEDFDYYLSRLKENIVTFSEIKHVEKYLRKIKDTEIAISPNELAKLAGFGSENGIKDKIDEILFELEKNGFITRDTNKFNTLQYKILKKKTVNTIEGIQKDIYIFLSKRKRIDIGEISFFFGKTRKEVITYLDELEDHKLISKDSKVDIEINDEEPYWQYTMLDVLKRILKDAPEGFFDIETLIAPFTKKHDPKVLHENFEKALLYWEKIYPGVERIGKSYWKIETNIIKEIKAGNSKLKKVYEYLYENYPKEKLVKVNRNKITNKLAISKKQLNEQLNALNFLGCITYASSVNVYEMQYQIKMNKKIAPYMQEHYQEKKNYYYSKEKRIHLMQEFLRRGADKYFAKEYFEHTIDDFSKKIFPPDHLVIGKFITEKKYTSLMNTLTEEQLAIIKSNYDLNLVLASPGSGKTMTLVRKIAYTILTNPDVNTKHFLMLTHMRSAANEFKERLYNLIGSKAYDLDIYTFDAYAALLLGKKWDQDVIVEFNDTTDKKGLVPFKTALYLDEYQDITPETFEFIKNIVQYSRIKKIIAVGDDDQLIMGFKDASPKYFDKFWDLLDTNDKSEFSLTKNFRSHNEIIDVANCFIGKLSDRKKDLPMTGVSNAKGKVCLIKCKSSTLPEPVYSRVINIGTDKKIAILTHTNEDSLDVYEFLKKNGVHANIILGHTKRFRWHNVLEILEFDQRVLKLFEQEKIISFRDLSYVLQEMKEHFGKSSNWDKLVKIKNLFANYDFITLRQWRDIIYNLDDSFFEDEIHDNIVITTIHKAKGKEYDVVILMDNKGKHNLKLKKSLIRKYYVALTRAKKELYVYTNNDYFDEAFSRVIESDKNDYSINEKVLYMGLSDVYLSANSNYSDYVRDNLYAGKRISFKELPDDKVSLRYLVDSDSHKVVVQTSSRFRFLLKKYWDKYKKKKLVVDNIIWWCNSNKSVCSYQVLCKVIFSKKKK